MKCELYHDNFQNFKRYNVPKAQLVIADIPYNIGADAYYKAIPGMLRLLRQERTELEGNYYGLRGLACDGMPRGSSPGKPTEESGLRALENGVSKRLAEIAETERVLSGDEACIRACLDALNGKYKEVIVMRYVRGYRPGAGDTPCGAGRHRDRERRDRGGRRGIPQGHRRGRMAGVKAGGQENVHQRGHHH